MTDAQDSASNLVSDAPASDPAQDAFGYAPFAHRIAKAILGTPHPEGLVMAIHGAWGAGKSTLLNFVKFDLDRVEAEQRPIVIDFNPWWFDGHQALAQQFLSQFAANLPETNESFRKIRTAISDYSDTIGTVIGAVTGQAWAKGVATAAANLVGAKPMDVPTLKKHIGDAITDSGKRFVFFVDDIDRLSAEEFKSVFKVIKALANFPYVVYVLAFDRDTVADALTQAMSIDGEAYLEKIVQAPFSLPTIEKSRLRQKFSDDIDKILQSQPVNSGNAKYWANIYFDGIDQYLVKPRDVVRIVNVLSVTYPAVAGEVNFADFIALEALRLFEPSLYSAIRENPGHFTGLRSDRNHGRADPEKTFHDAWLATVAPERQEAVKSLAMRMFPRLKLVWGNMGYSSEHLTIWRNELRICSPEVFDIYFQLGVSEHFLSNSEFNAFLAQATDGTQAGDLLLAAAAVRRPDGHSKARDYINRLREVSQTIEEGVAEVLLMALYDVGDSLFPRIEEAGFLPSRWQMIGLTNDLLKRVPAARRYPLLTSLVSKGRAITLCCSVIDSAERWRLDPARMAGNPLADFSEEELKRLAQELVTRLRNMRDEDFVQCPELDLVNHRWHQWGDPSYVKGRVNGLFVSEALLPVVLEGYMRYGTRQGSDDPSRHKNRSCEPQGFRGANRYLQPRAAREDHAFAARPLCNATASWRGVPEVDATDSRRQKSRLSVQLWRRLRGR